MADGMLALTWNNHSSTFCKTISSLRVKERYTDVTITCEGKFYQVHKFVLATCSEYFEKIFQETPCKHPVIVLRDVSCDELEALLNYMYIGSVSVAQSDLSRLIKVAELFQIKGLAVPDDPPKNSDSDSGVTNSENKEKTDSYYKGTGQESSRTSPYLKNKNTHSSGDDGYNSPHPKRMRGHENLSSGMQNTDDGQSDTASVGQMSSFDVHVKEEIHDITDSDSDGQDSRLEAPFVPKSEDPELSHDGQSLVPEGSQLAPPYITSTESQDIPPDEQALTQPVLSQHSFSDDPLSLPGPSDAQEWYSEVDASGGLPVSKGNVGDRNQEMLPLEASQQQPQRMMECKNSLQTPVVDGRGLKIHRCKYCSFSSPNKTNLEHHLMVHTGEKPYRCSFCPAAFSQKGNMKRHVQTHTGEKPYLCPVCPYRATLKQNLQVHMLKKHGTSI